MTTLYSRIGTALVTLLGIGALVMAACSQGSEGDRCNPNLNPGNGECNGGLTCMQPSLCPEAYCCPTTADGGPASSSNPNCQTGCNGGAASICNSGADAAAACEFACTHDPGDLSSSAASSCGASASDAGTDAGKDTGTVADAGPG